MLGKRSPQRGLFEADNLYLDFVGRGTFYGFLALSGDRLFSDEEFACLYCPDNGRKSVPPGLLARALVLQAHDKVSDEETVNRARYDMRWKVALRIELESRPFAKSTLQLFRAQLILNDKAREIFLASLQEAKRCGFLKRGKKKLVVDTTHIFGKGAVKDTYNLLADGIGELVRALARAEGDSASVWAAKHDLSCYFASSIKGTAEIDWSDKEAREAFLTGIVADARRLLQVAKRAVSDHGVDSEMGRSISRAAELLCALLVQDVKEKPEGGMEIRKGVAKDRTVSVTDPEMRHGRKSSQQRFDGHKATVAADAETGLITDVDILPGNAHDSQNVMEVVERSQQVLREKIGTVIGDSAYGAGGVRQQMADAGRQVVAKVPLRPRTGKFTKEDFQIDLKNDRVVCPAGNVCCDFSLVSTNSRWTGKKEKRKRFTFEAKTCSLCPLRAQCVTGSAPRSITLHPQEQLLREARQFQRTAAFRKAYSVRIVVEHRIARLVQLGIRKSRYFGRRKTLFQVLMAATVANLTLIANSTGGVGAFASCFIVTTSFLTVLFAFSEHNKSAKDLSAA
jgi:cell division FtsZ-interacting protein ZapD